MNRDLEQQLDEMGPAYRSVVDRLRAAETVELRTSCGIVGGCRFARLRRPALVAASVLFALALSVLALRNSRDARTTAPISCVSVSPVPLEYRLSPAELIASQHPDGGWQNDFLTRRNAEILSRCEGMEARIAYKKAMRNLRVRGLL